MKWWYEGFNVGGQVSSGEFVADSMEEAAGILREKGIYPQQIKQVGVEQIKPVLPQKTAAAFEEELGFISDQVEKKPSACEAVVAKPEPVSVVKMEETQPLPSASASSCEKPSASSSAVEEKKSICGACCGCGEAGPNKEEGFKDAGYYLKQDMGYVMEGFGLMVEHFTNQDDSVEKRNQVISNLSGVANRVMESVLKDYVMRRRDEDWSASVVKKSKTP